MSNEYIILEGKDYEKLIAQGMKHFNARKEDISVEVLESKKNIFSSYYKVKITKGDKKTLDVIESSIDIILNENLKSNARSIDFDFRDDGVYIKVEKGVTIVDIVTKIDLHRIQSVDLTKIKQGLETVNLNNWVKIADPQKEKIIDSECLVRLTKDKMQAYITITKPVGGNGITEEAIYEALRQNAVVFNINESEISKAAANEIYDKELLVAEGIEPQPGEDAKLTPLIPQMKNQSVSTRTGKLTTMSCP